MDMNIDTVVLLPCFTLSNREAVFEINFIQWLNDQTILNPLSA